MTRWKRGASKLVAMGLMMVLCVQAIGCGNKDDKDQADQKEFVYVASYEAIEGPQWVSASCASKDSLYFIGNTYDEEAMSSETKIYKRSLETGEITTLDIEIGSENANVSNMSVNADGNLVMIVDDYQMENEDDWENAVSSTTLKVISPQDGSVVMETDLTSILAGDERAYIQNMLIDGENNIYLSNGETKVWAFDATGAPKPTVELTNISWMMAMGVSKEGTVVFASYAQDSGEVQLQSIDFTTKSVGKTYENLPVSIGNGSIRIVPGNEKGIYISSGNNVYAYDLETQTTEELFNWIDSDVNGDYVEFFTVLDDGRVVALTRDYSSAEGKTEVITLTKTKASEIQQKEMITLGVMYSDSNTNTAVINFNKTNEKYRIQIKDYGTEDYETGLTQFNNDIISGNGPDIFEQSNTGLSIQQLSQKGILEDLNPYLDADADVHREDYFPSVLDAYSVDGKLFSIPNSFYVMTLIGKTSQVGDKQGWTLDDMLKVIEANPDVEEVFAGATKDSALQYSIMFGMDDYVNWETGECNFDTEEFAKVLEFANTFAKEYNYNEDEPSEPTKIQNGDLLLMLTSISGVQDYQMEELIFQEPITMIGYPTTSGNGSALSGNNAFGINAKSEAKEGAWEFLKSFISEDNYDIENGGGNYWGLPTLKSAYDKQMEKDMTPDYYTDENGEEVEQPKTSWGWGDFNADIFAATQEQVDKVTQLVESTTRTFQWDTQFFEIISEEAAPFFEGQKTAQEVTQIIQSRVQMYVNENR